MVPRNVTFGLAFGQRETDFKPGWNAGRTHHADEKRMEIGAVATLSSAGPDGVAAAPAFAGLVIAHGGEDVVVDVAGLLNGSGITGGVPFGEFGDRAGERNEFVRLEVPLQVRFGGHRGGDVLECSRVEGDPMLAADDRNVSASMSPE